MYKLVCIDINDNDYEVFNRDFDTKAELVEHLNAELESDKYGNGTYKYHAYELKELKITYGLATVE